MERIGVRKQQRDSRRRAVSKFGRSVTMNISVEGSNMCNTVEASVKLKTISLKTGEFMRRKYVGFTLFKISV